MPQLASANPYRKDDRLLLAEVVTRRQRKAPAAGGTARADDAASAERSRVGEAEAAFLPGSAGTALNDGFFEGAAAAAVERMMGTAAGAGSRASRSRSGSRSRGRDASPPAADEIAARSSTVRPKRAAAPRKAGTGGDGPAPRLAALQGFLAAAAAAPVFSGIAAGGGESYDPEDRSLSRSPDRGFEPEGERMPEVKGEKKAILEGFLAAVGLAPPPSREASDAVYEPDFAEERGLRHSAAASAEAAEHPAVARVAQRATSARTKELDAGEDSKVRFQPGGGARQPGGQAAKVAAASAVASALSNISNAAAARRAAADAVVAAAAQKEVGGQAADADADVAAATEHASGERGERSRSARRDRDRDRDRSASRKRRRSRSRSGSRRRRGRSRSRSRSRDQRRRRRSALDDDSPHRTPLVSSSDMQAAEQLAMARRMTTIVGTVGEQRLRPGDWTCPVCSAHNFASKFQCFRCAKAKNPFLEGLYSMPGVSGVGIEPNQQMMKVGDWLCQRCSAHNFASKFQCFRCGQGKNPMLEAAAIPLHLPHQAQIGGRSAAGLALKAAAMAGRGAGWTNAAALAQVQAQAQQACLANVAASATPSGFSAGPASGTL